MKTIDRTCVNFNGSTTGLGRAVERPDGRWDVTASFGSPCGGHVCDDGPAYQATVDSEKEALPWLESHGMYERD